MLHEHSDNLTVKDSSLFAQCETSKNWVTDKYADNNEDMNRSRYCQAEQDNQDTSGSGLQWCNTCLAKVVT